MNHNNSPSPPYSGKDFPGELVYRSLFTQSHSAMLLIHPGTGEIVDANRAACSFYGYDRETIMGMSIMEINTLSPEEVMREMENARSEKRNHFLFKHRLHSGKIRDVEVHSSSIRMGNEGLLFSIVNDLSEQLELIRSRTKALEDLQQTRTELQELREIIPICSYCKKIRDDKGAWDSLEAYIEKHSDSLVSHGICPECYRKEIQSLKQGG